MAWEDEMKTLMLAIVFVSLGLTSACFVSKKEVRSNQPLTQADCDSAGGKWKSNRCEFD